MDATEFANQIFPHWEEAMDRFFYKVEEKRQQLGATDSETDEALRNGYGDDIADEWHAWAGV